MQKFLVIACCLCLQFAHFPAMAQSKEPAGSDAAVERGLQYLARRQLPSGAWRTTSWGESTGVTALVLLSFLSAGHTPDEGLYGENITRGVQWILSHQRSDGLILSNLQSEGIQYEHGICTLLLTQLPDSENFREQRRGLEGAVRWILKTQNAPGTVRHPGGWPRNPLQPGNSDLSVTVWQIMALRGARELGCDVPQATLERAMDFVSRCHHSITGGFGDEPGHGADLATTAAAVATLTYSNLDRPQLAAGGEAWLAHHLFYPDSTYFFYGSYFANLGWHRRLTAGEDPQSARLEKLLVDIQSADGSWQPIAERETQAGPDYGTALALLTLTLRFHYLPIHEL